VKAIDGGKIGAIFPLNLAPSNIYFYKEIEIGVGICRTDQINDQGGENR
jgi:hypothetical protein